MSYEARIERDSITQYGERVTTIVCTLPRIVLAELNTHRMLSKSSASSRAIPVEKQIARLRSDPFYPVYWGKNQKGMQANEELTADQILKAMEIWDRAREANIGFAEELLDVGVHKQITNRRLECDMWHTVVITGTEWSNYRHLRVHKDAQPEIRKSAEMVMDLIDGGKPKLLSERDWHLPFTNTEDFERNVPDPDYDDGLRKLDIDELIRVSVGRSARVSYLTHDGKRAVPEDIRLSSQILMSGHMAPWEHALRPMTGEERELFARPKIFAAPGNSFTSPAWRVGQVEYFLGNVNGWVQARKLLHGEHDMMAFER